MYDDAKKVVNTFTHPVDTLVSGIESIGENICDKVGGWLSDHL